MFFIQKEGVYHQVKNYKGLLAILQNRSKEVKQYLRRNRIKYRKGAEGLQLKREFYSPVYKTEQQALSRMPDFRNLLYWSPDVQTDSSGQATVEFYTSDMKGKYVAVLQGMNEAGYAGSYYFTFDVNEK